MGLKKKLIKIGAARPQNQCHLRATLTTVLNPFQASWCTAVVPTMCGARPPMGPTTKLSDRAQQSECVASQQALIPDNRGDESQEERPLRRGEALGQPVANQSRKPA